MAATTAPLTTGGTAGVNQMARVYFKCLSEHAEKWDEHISQADCVTRALANQSEQLRDTKRVDLAEDFEEFPGLHDLLRFKILLGIDDECSRLRTINDRMSKMVQDLRNKLAKLSKSSESVDWEDPKEIRQNVLQPELTTVLQIALECWSYYDESMKNIKKSISSFDARNVKSVEILLECFKHSERYDRIKFVLALMKYCIEDDR